MLGLFPTARGFGYALLDEERKLIDWGTKGLRGADKNRVSLKAVALLIDHHRPTRVVLEYIAPTKTRRHLRIRVLHAAIEHYARSHRIPVRTFPREQVFRYFNVRTKHELAVAVGAAFPPLLPRMPKKRRAWDSEHARQSLFDAVALALVCIHTLEGTAQQRR